MTLSIELLRAVCRANINGIDVYDDFVYVGGTSDDSDEVAVQFPTPDSPDLLRELAEHFGVDIDVVADERSKS